jgi:O-antigen/teichoic acid export membrane protein
MGWDITASKNDHEKIKHHVVRGGVITFLAQGYKFLLNLVSTMILARLLAPQDFGLIAMAAVLSGFLMTFKDLGLSVATIQASQITQTQVSNLFWINLLVGFSLMLIMMLCAPILASFYGDGRLIYIVGALSIAFLLNGFSVQFQAVLSRELKFSVLAKLDVASISVGVCIGVFFAYWGLGYWSLVLMQVAIAMFNAIGLWLSSSWRPGKFEKKVPIVEMLKFGGHLTLAGALNYFSRNLDNILVGHFFGPRTLGLYSKAYSLLLLPIGQIVAPMNSVILPVLCRLQADSEGYRKYYLNSLKMIAYTTFPMVMLMGVLADEVILGFLGPQWVDAILIFKILAAAALFQPVVSTVGWLYMSLGETRRMARWGVVTAILISLSFLFGLKWGVLGVACSYSVICILLVVPEFYMAIKGSPISLVDIFKTLFPPLAIGVITSLIAGVSKYFLFGYNPFMVMIISTVIGLICAFFLMLSLKSLRADLLTISNTLKLAFKIKPT